MSPNNMEQITEIIGYIGTAFVIFSFVMKDMIKLRIINIIGCSVFIIYSVLMESIPLILTNSMIIMVHGFYLWRYIIEQKSLKNEQSQGETTHL